MAGSSFFMLLDDIAAVADDVAIMAKAATKKTVGVLGDDLALNAEQVTGINSNRELPVIWAVFKGAVINKLILVPVALIISYFANWLIIPFLMLGGAYLCFEGFEKIYHNLFHKEDVIKHVEEHKSAIKNPAINMVQFEKDKIKGAIRTDFILSAEIIAITLGVIGGASIFNQVIVLTVVALGVTCLVYCLVAGIVRIDDVGFWIKKNTVFPKIGMFLIFFTPYLMKFLSIVGTVAMFLVGGGIIAHGIPFVHHVISDLVADSGVLGWLTQMVLDGSLGLIVGGMLVTVFNFFSNIKK